MVALVPQAGGDALARLVLEVDVAVMSRANERLLDGAAGVLKKIAARAVGRRVVPSAGVGRLPSRGEVKRLLPLAPGDAERELGRDFRRGAPAGDP